MNRRKFLKTLGKAMIGVAAIAASPTNVVKAIAATGTTARGVESISEPSSIARIKWRLSDISPKPFNPTGLCENESLVVNWGDPDPKPVKPNVLSCPNYFYDAYQSYLKKEVLDMEDYEDLSD